MGFDQGGKTLRRTLLIITLSVLLLFSTYGGANPGGVGNGNFDMQCGGACHGDSAQNQTSPALLELSIEAEAYLGLPISVKATVSGVQFSSSDTIGLFLLTDTTGHSDLPQDADWEVISDTNGGSDNYVEIEPSSLQNEYEISWTIKPLTVEETTFYLSIHHGGDDVPFFAISSGLTIQAQPIPANLPRLADEYSPTISRELGESTTMEILTQEVEKLQVEWRLVGGELNTVNATSVGDDIWQFELPSAIQPSIIEWRAILDGEGPQQVTPWFRIAAQEPVLNINQLQMYVQSLAFCVFFGAIILTLHVRFMAENSDQLPTDLHSEEEIVSGSLPLPEGGLPSGWTMEQWKWYGHEYKEDQQ